ncbi:MAG: alpha/beta fold hydrolase [Wenzhouxiangella sp.]|nr:alpha/beta fold hydrolase [Wenzhouxiangella sp.]
MTSDTQPAMPHDQPVIPIETRDGHSFELIHVRASDAMARLLFLPGMGLSARQYISFAQALAGWRVDTLIHEWRGLGSSNLRASRGTDWGYRELLIDDLAASIEQSLDMSPNLPLLVGGHSLGSQLALLAAAMRPDKIRGLLIVAGGAPYWRCFNGWMRYALHGIFFAMPNVARLVGHYPGRRLGFAGREARGVMTDWAQSGKTGMYRPENMEFDFESALGKVQTPMLSLNMTDDWFVPQASVDWLTGKLTSADKQEIQISNEGMRASSDHYQWMKEPDTSAAAIGHWVAAQWPANNRP